MPRPPALVHLAQQPARAAAASASAAASSPAQLPLSRRSFSSAAAPSTTNTRTRSTATSLNGWVIEQQPLARRRSAPSSSRSFHSSTARTLNKNPYSVLGVKKESSVNEIKKAYYGLAKRYHPDSSTEKDAKEKFVEIQEAYDILSDDKKRADFDRFGSASTQPGFDSDAYARATSSFGGAGFGDFFGGGMGGGPGGPGGADIFESLFGAFGRGGSAGGPRQTVPVGDDIEVSISVPFLDAAKGASRTIAISPVVDCHTCHGSGLREGMHKAQCGSCGGSGTRTFTIQSGFQMASTCSACGGSGSVAPPGSNCGTCAGVGKVRERRTVEVKIPPGVDDGMKIRLDGKGDAPLTAGGSTSAKAGRNGDLFVRINVQPSKVFSRQGSNLYQNVHVPFYTAILGGRAPVKTLDRDVEVRVPQGTQPGEEMVLRGRGVKKLYKDDHGDLVRRILEQFVAETDMPGSTAHYPTTSSSSASASSSSSPSSSRRPAPSSSSSSAAGAAASAPPAGDEPQVATPPPREGAPDKPQWWSTMSDDISSTATDKARAAAGAAERASSESVEDKLDEAKERFESVREEVGDAFEGVKDKAAEAVKEGKEAVKDAAADDDDKHSLLGDLWKAGKKKVKKAKEAVCDDDDAAKKQ
ncbi:uncharacterized protein RHOBADRAFT_51996 [Rhodotorula graminis WP1]|uniref:J domain-containing protein n=1 Tax=Rhodotorula graminis (strain WP1) TaxID=578459 RepID=A0A194S8W0_RHOGW|nr:uncharacterized protein RHOBADRAFT_51996 [Rhodotorula graminis WP1]KPV77032.1 hypothetical protein RHOBADRAFT_51996 [Rhodotorula graminis WP1]